MEALSENWEAAVDGYKVDIHQIRQWRELEMFIMQNVAHELVDGDDKVAIQLVQMLLKAWFQEIENR